jgi:TRAP-type transport system periplasmic protein
MKRAAALILGAALGAATLMPASAEVTELKLGNTTPASGNQSISANEFARRVNEKMAGKVHITVYDNSQLGNERELLQKLKIGTVDFSQPSTIMSTVAPEFGLFDMPYLIKDRTHLEKFVDTIFWREMAPKVEAKGYKIIAVYENGFRHITNNKRPINTPEDLKGLKIRIPRGVWRQKMFETYGASPAPMEFSELFVALQSGVMDGQENPLSNIWGASSTRYRNISLSRTTFTRRHSSPSA